MQLFLSIAAVSHECVSRLHLCLTVTVVSLSCRFFFFSQLHLLQLQMCLSVTAVSLSFRCVSQVQLYFSAAAVSLNCRCVSQLKLCTSVTAVSLSCCYFSQLQLCLSFKVVILTDISLSHLNLSLSARAFMVPIYVLWKLSSKGCYVYVGWMSGYSIHACTGQGGNYKVEYISRPKKNNIDIGLLEGKLPVWTTHCGAV